MDDTDTLCCGNGCNACVLDEKWRSNQQNSNCLIQKINILSQNYQIFSVKSIKTISPNYRQILFKFSNVNEINLDEYNLYVPPGFHLFTRVPVINGSLKTIARNKKYDADTVEEYNSRPYTPITVTPHLFQFEIIVKLEGSMSSFFANLTIGDYSEWKGVYGDLIWQRNQHSHLVCFTQGVGIAPIYRLIQSILDDEEDETRIELHSCFREMSCILLRNELHSMRQYWNFKATIYLSQSHNTDCKIKHNEVILERRLIDDDVRDVVEKLSDNNALFLICGTNVFIGNIKNWLEHFNVRKDKIFVYQ